MKSRVTLSSAAALAISALKKYRPVFALNMRRVTRIQKKQCYCVILYLFLLNIIHLNFTWLTSGIFWHDSRLFFLCTTRFSHVTIIIVSHCLRSPSLDRCISINFECPDGSARIIAKIIKLSPHFVLRLILFFILDQPYKKGE